MQLPAPPKSAADWLGECRESFVHEGRRHKEVAAQFEFLHAKALALIQAGARPPAYRPLEDLRKWLDADGGADDDSRNPVRVAIGFMQEFDRLALAFQSKHFRQINGVCAGALIFLVCFELFAHLPFKDDDYPFGIWPILLAGIACLVCSAVLVRGFQRGKISIPGSRQTQMAYLDCRCIAEMVRVLAFWRLNGIDGCVDDHLPRTYKVRFALVKRVVNQLEKELGAPSRQPVPMSEEATRRHWELDQALYFHLAREKQHLISEFWLETSGLLFYIGIAGVVALIFASVLQIPKESTPVKLLLTFTPCFIVLSAIAEFYLERRGHESNAARNEHSEEVFRSDHIPGKAFHEICESDLRRVWWRWPALLATALALAGVLALHRWSLPGVTPEALVYLALGIPLVAVAAAGADLAGTLQGCQVSASDRETWTSHRCLTKEGSWEKHVESVGEEALRELIHWYISSSDRVVTLPKG